MPGPRVSLLEIAAFERINVIEDDVRSIVARNWPHLLSKLPLEEFLLASRKHASPASRSLSVRIKRCEVNMAHTTEFPLVTGPISRPVDVIRLLAKGGLPLQVARSVVERLATADIKGCYDHERDRLYVEIVPGPSAETSEMPNGLRIALDADGNVIGLDIDNGSHLGALLRDFVASGATVEDLARAWASLSARRDEFDARRRPDAHRAARGHYLGYFIEAEEILRRAAKYARERSSVSQSSPANRAPPALSAEPSNSGPQGDVG